MGLFRLIFYGIIAYVVSRIIRVVLHVVASRRSTPPGASPGNPVRNEKESPYRNAKHC